MFRTIAVAGAATLLAAVIATGAPAQTSGTGIETGKCEFKRAPGFEFPGPYTVYFELGSDVVQPQYRDELRKAVEDAKAVYVQQICLWGHTDKLGNAEYNERLALRRAANVRKVLDELGFPASKIVITSDGEAFQSFENTGVDESAKDRRVVVRLAK